MSLIDSAKLIEVLTSARDPNGIRKQSTASSVRYERMHHLGEWVHIRPKSIMEYALSKNMLEEISTPEGVCYSLTEKGDERLRKHAQKKR